MDTTHRSAHEIYPPGTIIGERYEIISHLAQGGMANVYVATQRNMNRDVALKILSSEFSSNQGVVSRFMREAHIVGNLQHPNTVSVYDMGETPDGRLFISMELLKGISLGDRIRNGAIPPAEILPIARQVASSLQDAHRAGIIHRDLKPDNIFLTTLGVAKVLDFGIAKIRDDDGSTEKRLTRAGTAPGTPEYMSPEQARGQDLDARSDLYSLGIVMYEMLCGHPPFDEPTFLATVLQHVQSPPPPLPEELPLALRNYVINRLLAKDPNCRPDNAELFIQEIDELNRKLFTVENDDIAESAEALVKAQAEIEELRTQLAKTKQELLRSADVPALDPSLYAASSAQPQWQSYAATQPEQRSAPPTTTRQGQTASGMNPMVSRQQGSGLRPHPNAQQGSGLRPHPNAPRQGRDDSPLGSSPNLAPISPMPARSGQSQQPNIQRPSLAPASANPQMGRQAQAGSGINPHPNMPRQAQQGPTAPPNMPRQGGAGMPASPIPPSLAYQGPGQSFSSSPALAPSQQNQDVGRQNHPSAMPQSAQPTQGSSARPDTRMDGGVQRLAPQRELRQNRVEEDLVPPPPRRLGPLSSPKPEDILMPGPRSSSANPRVQRQAEYAQPSQSKRRLTPVPMDNYEDASDERYTQSSKRGKGSSASDFNKRITEVEHDDADKFSNAPANALTGQRLTRKNSSSQSAETTFMMYCQPLIPMLGQENTEKTLRLAQGIWNASVLGSAAIKELLVLFADNPSLTKIAEHMLKRKAELFSEHRWQIDNLQISTDREGRLSIDFSQG